MWYTTQVQVVSSADVYRNEKKYPVRITTSRSRWKHIIFEKTVEHCISSLNRMYAQFIYFFFLCSIPLGLSRTIKPFYFMKCFQPDEGHIYDTLTCARSLFTKAIAHSVKVDRWLCIVTTLQNVHIYMLYFNFWIDFLR